MKSKHIISDNYLEHSRNLILNYVQRIILFNLQIFVNICKKYKIFQFIIKKIKIWHI
jgi:hypothetical protein